MVHRFHNLLLCLVVAALIATAGAADADEKASTEWPAERVFEDAMSGSADAQWELASFYIQNEIEEDQGLQQPGSYWLQTAADNGHADAINEVGWGHLWGRRGFELDPAQAQAWFIKGVNANNPHAAYNLSTIYRDGIGFSRDDYLATYWLQRSADLGMQVSLFKVAFRYGEGVGTRRDTERMTKMLEALAASGFNPHVLLASFEIPLYNTYAELDQALSKEEFSADRLLNFPQELLSMISDFESELLTAGSASFELNGESVSLQSDQPVDDVFRLLMEVAQLGSTAAQQRVAQWYESGELADGASAADAEYWRDRANSNPDQVD